MSTEHALPGQFTLPFLVPLTHEEKRQALYRAHLAYVNAGKGWDRFFPFPDPDAEPFLHPHRLNLRRFYDDLLLDTLPNARPPRWAVPVLKELGVSL